jgi:hypothetical protein
MKSVTRRRWAKSDLRSDQEGKRVIRERQIVWQDEHRQHPAADCKAVTTAFFDEAADAGLESRDKDEQPYDQNKPNAEYRKQIQDADFNVLACQDKIIVIYEFEQREAEDERQYQNQRHDS